MKSRSFGELSRRERLHCFRELAQTALDSYGFSTAKLTLIQYHENVVYRVDLPASSGRYLLRLHAWDEMGYINGEMLWLDALSRQARLPVPTPVRTLEGNFLIKVVSDRLPSGRWVTVTSWLEGRKLERGLRPIHLKSLGQVMAKMHNFSATWKPPNGFSRPTWDWDAQLGGSQFDVRRDDLIDSMPDRFQEPFLVIEKLAKEAMASLGSSSDVFGLIHTDLYPENILFNAGQPQLIDFEDCGYGHWMWDIAVPLGIWAWGEDWQRMRDAFHDGYAPIRSLSDGQWELLDLFIATQHATMLLWASAFLKHDPKRVDEYIPWRDDSGNNLLKYFNREDNLS